MSMPLPRKDLLANLQQILDSANEARDRARTDCESEELIAVCEEQVRKVENLIERWSRG